MSPHLTRPALAVLLLAASTALPATVRAAAAPRTLSVEAGSGRILTLPSPASNVFVADPHVVEVRPAGPATLFVFGVGQGRTTIAAMDASGAPLADVQVIVSPSTFAAGLAQSAARQAVNDGHVVVQPAPRGLIVSGEVATPADAARVLSIARSHLAEGQTIEDQLGVRSSVQVLLKVRIVEMSRQVTRNLGINWQAIGSVGRFAIGLNTMTALASTLSASTPSTLRVGTADVNALVDALAQDNLARVLAEPNLTAMSGQAASFLAGGEFPIPVGQQNNQVTIEFKPYGVKLTFVPTVLSSDRINLHVNPEVSQLTSQGAVQLTAGNSSLQIPALTVRRAETTVEVGSGQSFAIAGLLQDSVQQDVNAVPFLGEIPILGALFRSDGYQRQETELVVIVTPYIARPSSDPAGLHAPGEASLMPNDRQRLLGLEQVAPRAAPPRRLAGASGFVVQ